MKDHETLETHNIKDGMTVHLVIRSGNAGSNNRQNDQPQSNPAGNPSQTPFGLGGVGGIKTQCGSFRIFLSLRFYVKSILGILEVQKLPFLPFYGLWILLIWSISALKKCKNSKKQNSKLKNMLKWQILHFWNAQN